jgi:hypothetical protein
VSDGIHTLSGHAGDSNGVQHSTSDPEKGRLLMSDFMQRQVTGLENWLRVETTQGTEFVRIADTSLFVRNSDCPSQPLTDDEREETINKIRDPCHGFVAV